MTLDEAREILEARGFEFAPDGSIDHPTQHYEYLDAEDADGLYDDKAKGPRVGIDGAFTADQLEALAVWMRAHAKEGG